MEIIILAAGQGKRMRSNLPKVLQSLSGKPLLEHVLNASNMLNAQKTCVVFGHNGNIIRERLNTDNVTWVEQQPQLGTGHAVLQALPHLTDHCQALILYGDVPLIRPSTLKRLVQAAGKNNLALLTVMLDDPTGYGRIIRNANGKVLRIAEEKDATDAERTIKEVNTGILVAPVTRLRQWLQQVRNDNAQGEYYLTDIISLAVADGVEIVTVQPDAAWETLGVNSKSQLAALERTHQHNIALTLMEQGVTLFDPNRLDVRGALTCGRDVEIDVNCVFEGQVELEDGVRIGAHCVIRNTKIGAGSHIAPFSHIDQSIIGTHCLIGPYARMRPGTTLGSYVHIGNFVEIKNTKIADTSKVNHLSYIGDADIGQRVNVGAGTITCNYDGVNKYQTLIEDGAFIGSDSQLVAPVRIGRNATIGAGTTVTKDAPAEQLTISRTRQTAIPNWRRPLKKN